MVRCCRCRWCCRRRDGIVAGSGAVAAGQLREGEAAGTCCVCRGCWIVPLLPLCAVYCFTANREPFLAVVFVVDGMWPCPVQALRM